MLKLVPAMEMDFSSVLDYYNSFGDNKDFNSYAIWTVFQGPQEYFDYLAWMEEKFYYLIDDMNPSYIIGYGSIDDSAILDYHKEHLNKGAIGCGVRPSERRKGYATYLLQLLLEKCEEMGMHEVCVSCLKENVASDKVIRNNGGRLEKEFFDDDSGKWGFKYWIKLHPHFINRVKHFKKIRK